MIKRVINKVKNVIDRVSDILSKVKAIFKRALELRSALRNGESIDSFSNAFIIFYGVIGGIIKVTIQTILCVLLINAIVFVIFGNDKKN